MRAARRRGRFFAREVAATVGAASRSSTDTFGQVCPRVDGADARAGVGRLDAADLQHDLEISEPRSNFAEGFGVAIDLSFSIAGCDEREVRIENRLIHTLELLR